MNRDELVRRLVLSTSETLGRLRDNDNRSNEDAIEHLRGGLCLDEDFENTPDTSCLATVGATP